MIVVLCGASGTGKTSVRNYLCENFRYEKIKTGTTRKKRDNEDEYDYMDYKDMLRRVVNNSYVFATEYNGEVYATPMAAFDHENPMLILDAKGASMLKESFGTDSIVICLSAPKRICMDRMIARGDSFEKIDQRMDSFEKDYHDCLDICDYEIYAEGTVEQNAHNVLTCISLYSGNGWGF